MSQGYTRCHYTSPEGFECEQFFPYADDGNYFCPVHIGAVSASLAANGHNKDAYIEKDKQLVFSLVEATKGMTDKEALAFYDQHYIKIQNAIEQMKHEQQVSRALKQQRMNNLSEAEREELRRAPRQMRVKNESAAGELGKQMKAREKAISNIIEERKRKGKETTREQAIQILESD